MWLKNLALGCLVVVLSVVGISHGAYAIKCPSDSLRAKEEVNSLAECNVPKEKDGEKGLMERINIIINAVISVVGIVAVAVMVYAGIIMVTSQGESAKVARARAAMIYGAAGLVICVLAFAIVNFILRGVFG